MEKRLKLHDIFVNILGTQGEEESRVYFQPPSNVRMKYPCIRYQRSRNDEQYANNVLYNHTTGYTVTVIDSDPDSEIPAKVGALPMCSFNQHYTADNLNHDVYNIYY